MCELRFCSFFIQAVHKHELGVSAFRDRLVSFLRWTVSASDAESSHLEAGEPGFGAQADPKVEVMLCRLAVGPWAQFSAAPEFGKWVC